MRTTTVFVCTLRPPHPPPRKFRAAPGTHPTVCPQCGSRLSGKWAANSTVTDAAAKFPETS